MKQKNRISNTEGVMMEDIVPEIGKIYPIYGMITDVLFENEKGLIVELNGKIEAHINLPKKDSVQTLKKKAFELGIFVSTVININPEIVVECKQAIFGDDYSENVH